MSAVAAGTRSWRRWGLFVACQFLVVVLLAEAAVRIAATRHRGLRMVLSASTDTTDFSDVETLQELMDRSMLGFRPLSVEYGFVLNSRSFRTAEYSPGSAHDRFRVVALGDSFTFASGGLPHEDHWSTVMERELARRSNRSVEVLRLGVPGTGPAFQLRLWELEVAGLEPDLVVVGFFIGNDFVDHQEVHAAFGGDRRGFGSWLADRSALFRLTRNLLRVSNSGDGIVQTDVDGSEGSPEMAGRPISAYGRTFDPDRPTFDRDRFVEIESRRMALCLNSEVSAFSELAARVVPVVTELAAAIEAGGARCLVMVIPDQFQVDDGLAEDILRATGHRLEDYDLDRPQRTLVPKLEAAGVEVVDLLPVFRSVSRGADLYRPRDTHWNRRGNAIAAAVLADLVVPRGSEDEIFTDGLEIGDVSAWEQPDEE